MKELRKGRILSIHEAKSSLPNHWDAQKMITGTPRKRRRSRVTFDKKWLYKMLHSTIGRHIWEGRSFPGPTQVPRLSSVAPVLFFDFASTSLNRIHGVLPWLFYWGKDFEFRNNAIFDRTSGWSGLDLFCLASWASFLLVSSFWSCRAKEKWSSALALGLLKTSIA